MSLPVMCPECFVDFEVPDEFVGKKVRCPHCRGAVLVESGDDAEFAAALDSVAEEFEADEPPELPPRRRTTDKTPQRAKSDAPAAAASDAPKKRKRKRKAKPLSERLGLSDIDPDTIKLFVGLGAMVIFGFLGYWGIKQLMKYPPPPDIPDAEWHAFSSDGWEATFPGTPRRLDLSMAGTSMVVQMVERGQDSAFGVFYTTSPLPADRLSLPPEQLLNDMCDGSMANLSQQMGGEEVSRELIQMGDYPGMELVAYASKLRGNFISRCYIANGRAYISLCGGKGFEPGQHNVDKFFDSFKIH